MPGPNDNQLAVTIATDNDEDPTAFLAYLAQHGMSESNDEHELYKALHDFIAAGSPSTTSPPPATEAPRPLAIPYLPVLPSTVLPRNLPGSQYVTDAPAEDSTSDTTPGPITPSIPDAPEPPTMDEMRDDYRASQTATAPVGTVGQRVTPKTPAAVSKAWAAFGAKYGIPAAARANESGIPASWVVAMGIQDTGGNVSSPTPFGIKGFSPAGNGRSLNTWEVDENGNKYNTTAMFATYKTPDEAVQHLLSQPLLKAAPKDEGPAAFFQYLLDHHWATDPNWAANVTRIASQLDGVDYGSAADGGSTAPNIPGSGTQRAGSGARRIGRLGIVRPLIDPTTGAGVGPDTALPSGGVKVRPLSELMGGPRTMTPTEADYYFPYGGSEAEAGGANRNLLRTLGYNPDSGSPLTQYLQREMTPLSLAAQADLMSRNAPAATGDIVGAMGDRLRSGQTSYFSNPQESQDFLNRVAGFSTSDPTGQSEDQMGLTAALEGPPQNTGDLIFAARSAGLAPLLRNNLKLQDQITARMYESWRNAGGDASGQSFLQYWVQNAPPIQPAIPPPPAAPAVPVVAGA